MDMGESGWMSPHFRSKNLKMTGGTYFLLFVDNFTYIYIYVVARI